MPLPAIFTVVPLGLERAPLETSFTHVLNFVTQNQTETNWCWAAVTCSISAYYSSATTWKQCSIVNDELGLETCCVDGTTDDCNQPWTLDTALTATGNLNVVTEEAKTYAEVQAIIDATTPLCARIAWTGGGGHFVTLYGYTNPSVLYVADPFYGYTLIDVADFPASYNGGGTWTDSYTTEA